MKLPVQIVFLHMAESKAIRRQIVNRAQQMNRGVSGIINCRVLLDLPYHHRYKGNLYHLNIEVLLQGKKTLSVVRKPSADGADSDIHATIRDAFNELSQKIKDHIRTSGSKPPRRSQGEKGLSENAESELAS